MTPPVFAHGHLRLYLLSLLAESEDGMHGYELMQALSERFGGTYSPSAGTIYPRLAKLEDEGLVTKTTDGRRSVYRITKSGRAELAERAYELDGIENEVTDTVRRLANEVRSSVNDAMRSLRAELASAARGGAPAGGMTGNASAGNDSKGRDSRGDHDPGTDTGSSSSSSTPGSPGSSSSMPGSSSTKSARPSEESASTSRPTDHEHGDDAGDPAGHMHGHGPDSTSDRMPEAEATINAFRSTMRTELRLQLGRGGRLSAETVKLLASGLDDVRAKVVASLEK